ncbi:hypothetical protein DAEQUDRAFT_403616 [Daedalea quercina L-15889]|uniref:Uncharacterized protein n=1 Tax=Daedalea quercina L-15889 TaxID=1314783 RepID=A0A165NRR6_9APHY|nr:hypothetical protein DAEQUDRAFT_403616 [Daedalea quercina L-15889]
MGDMSLIKMQGVDGVLEPISYVPNGTDRVYALQTALERMVATGATEMYATIDGNSSVHWAQTVEYTYTTSRTRLGSAAGRSLGFITGPVVLTALIFIGWLLVGFDRNGDVCFNPLSPSNVAAAATRTNVDLDTASGQRQLDRLPLLLKYDQVSDGRNGLNAVEPQADEGDKGWPLLAIIGTPRSWEQDHKLGGEEGPHWDPADLYKVSAS